MGYLMLNLIISVSCAIHLVCGNCAPYSTKQEFFDSVEGVTRKPFVLNDKFAVKLNEKQCAADVEKHPYYNHAFAKYIDWSEKEVMDESTHYGCTCQEVISLFDFAENTNPNHIMCRLQDIYGTFCDGFPKGASYKEKSASLQEKLNALHSDFLEYILHNSSEVLSQYLANRDINDAQWPLAKTLDDIKKYKETYETRTNAIMSNTSKASLAPYIAHVHVSMISLIMARAMDVGLEPKVVEEIIGGVNFNSVAFAIKLMALEKISNVPSIKQYVLKDVSKLPSMLHLTAVVLTPVGICPKTGPAEMLNHVRSFVEQIFQHADAMKNNWEVETTQKALSVYCKMALKDLKVVYEKKRAAEEMAKAVEERAKAAGERAKAAATEGAKIAEDTEKEKKDDTDRQQEVEGDEKKVEPCTEELKLTAIRESFKSFADKAALDKYIADNLANMEETYVITADDVFTEDVTLTCSYN